MTNDATSAMPQVGTQQSDLLTTSTGVPVRDTDHTLKAGPRGPSLLQDHHLREKITHFDHERIPERVVHARGAAAHGTFTAYGAAEPVTSAAFLKEGVETPVFVRFSTVAGSRGSADTVRDVRGFATKFYTEQGNFDLVGNDMPIFFIQDAIKFPDLVHAAKPHPDVEIPQAATAHDTFWDFVSLHTEAQHMLMWAMSDRGIPRSLRTVEGFGIHTFRLINAEGETSLVKFHWKPKLGVHAQLWEEALMTGGFDPDFHRRDLAEAIDAGSFPEWEFGIQVLPDTPEQTFEGIDLLDPTKIVPEELAPVQPIGKMVLNRNPTNYFAETEQAAFHPGHLVPGIDVTDDPLLQGRLFSYLDTQITRLGGPNFNQIPINRPHAPVNDMLRDGPHQDGVHEGIAPYRPNSLDGGCPFAPGNDFGEADERTKRAFLDAAVTIPATTKTREQAASFDDHFGQARLFWVSMTDIERDHIVSAFSFELGKCTAVEIRERQVANLANIDAELASRVADNLGLSAPGATLELGEVEPSPALSMMGRSWPVDGRKVGVVVSSGTSVDEIHALVDAIEATGMKALLIGPRGGRLSDGTALDRSLATTRSIEFDAIVLADGTAPLAGEQELMLLVWETFRHAKAIGAWGDGAELLGAASLQLSSPGVVVEDHDAAALAGDLAGLLAQHRVWERLA